MSQTIGGEPGKPSPDDVEDEFGVRARPLLATVHVPLRDLLLDPGDELSVADDPTMAADAAFLRAFAPMRSYQRLVATGLEGLMSQIARQPSSLVGRILVRVQVTADDGTGQYVVIDGSRHVAALRRLAETGMSNGAWLTGDVTIMFDACPVTIVQPDTEPAFVLALLADATETGADEWIHGQRNGLLRRLAVDGVQHGHPTVIEATRGNPQILRRYHAYRAMQQLMQQQDVPHHVAARLYPLFYAAVGRSAIRSWLEWEDGIARFTDDDALEHFYRLLQPSLRPDGTTRPPCITGVDDVVQLCDVLAEPAAKAVLEGGATLPEAVEVINAGVYQQWATQVGEAFESMRWDRRRFGRQ